MTTATSTQGKTEFMVSPNTSSKELFDQLNELKADKGANADLPIRAYDKGSNPYKLIGEINVTSKNTHSTRT
jgi:hypothetical protein